MTRDDVIKLFQAWRSAGLKPPVSTPEQGNQMIDAFYNQYRHLKPEEVVLLSSRLSRLKYWPRFYDVDEALSEIYNKQQSERKKFQTPEESRLSRNLFIEKVLGGRPQPGETWVDAMAKKFAKHHYPECTECFISENKMTMATQLEADFICHNCKGLSVHECLTGGHRPFLRVDKYTGICVEFVDCDFCDKVILPLKRSGENTPRMLPKNSGPAAVGEIASTQFGGLRHD